VLIGRSLSTKKAGGESPRDPAMTYRNDSDALLARIDALEAENRRLRGSAEPHTTPPRGPDNRMQARAELDFLLSDRARRERGTVMVTATLAALATFIVPMLVGELTGIFVIFAMMFALIAVTAYARILPITGDRSDVHFERITYLRAYLVAHDRMLGATTESATGR
jgi:hypothetical protein